MLNMNQVSMDYKVHKNMYVYIYLLNIVMYFVNVKS